MEFPKSSISSDILQPWCYESIEGNIYLSIEQLSLSVAQGVFDTCQLVPSVAQAAFGIHPVCPSGAETGLDVPGQNPVPWLFFLTLSS